jgi:hypothetical protein
MGQIKGEASTAMSVTFRHKNVEIQHKNSSFLHFSSCHADRNCAEIPAARQHLNGAPGLLMTRRSIPNSMTRWTGPK